MSDMNNDHPDVVQKLWGFCHILRHDGIDYGDYIEQITYLLFSRWPTSKASICRRIAAECDWPHLRKQSGAALTRWLHRDSLRTLGKQQGILGDIFAAAQNRFKNPVNLKQLIGLIDETEWTSLDVDVKAAAFEGLLEKAAAEGKKGAGQYFTPRVADPVMVRLHEARPAGAAGTSPSATRPAGPAASSCRRLRVAEGTDRRRVRPRGRQARSEDQDLLRPGSRRPAPPPGADEPVPAPGRAAHHARRLDLRSARRRQRFDVSSPTRRSAPRARTRRPIRDDFTVETSNKQLNFLQHVLTLLKPGGRAPSSCPTTCLFADQAGEVFKVLMEDCDVHTVLRCPRGTFSSVHPGHQDATSSSSPRASRPRTPGSTTRGPTSRRSPRSPGRSAPTHFAEFERCYGDDPNGGAKRVRADSTDDRWRSFTLDEIKERDYKLDGFKWLRDDRLDDPDEISRPGNS